jgi:hypothetical protein
MRRALVVILAGLAASGVPPGQARPASAAAKIAVSEAWARPLPPGTRTAEFYLIITNTGDRADHLVGARSPACGAIELFEYHGSATGMMGMRPVAGQAIEVKPGRVEFRVGGWHLMCMDRKGDLTAGSRLPLTLRFRDSGEVQTQIVIRDR